MLYITNTTIVSPPEILAARTVRIDEGVIQAIYPSSEAEIPPDAATLDGESFFLVPGFIDLQINGGFGHDFTSDSSSIWDVAIDLPQYGVTAFLPTIVTSPLETVAVAQAVMMSDPARDFLGASPLGLHLEGPFLNQAKKGAHDESHLRLPELEDIVDWSVSSGVRMVTLAPELPQATWIGGLLAERGILVAAGHSQATYNQARAAFNQRFRYATHLFNAMPPLHHREPGLAGAALSDERVTVGLIADGIHVHPALVKSIWQITNDGRLNLVSDAIAALGMAPGTYQLGDRTVIVDQESCRLSDGTLSGSNLSLDKALQNLITFTGCSLPDAIRTVSSTPAVLLGLGDRKGRIVEGYDADLVMLSQDLEVVVTLVGGKIAYTKAD
jgi:N-acetylglucosamine-6-phosphate deacetylase